MNDIPDWVLLEAAKRFEWPGTPVSKLRCHYEDPEYCGYRALCDMIAKHEQPPADPDEEAVKRIMCAWFAEPIFFPNAQEELARAVSQYKQEKANG